MVLWPTSIGGAYLFIYFTIFDFVLSHLLNVDVDVLAINHFIDALPDIDMRLRII